MSREINVVMGTYNRLPMLKQSIESLRDVIKDHLDQIIVIDGDSTDGTVQWLEAFQSNVVWGRQGKPLTGAVQAFNMGFALASLKPTPFVLNFNDDAILEGDIETALDALYSQPKIAQVAFAFDLWSPGSFHHDHVNGVPYANYGLVRREVGRDVARAQGDPAGLKWWDPSYWTYAADTQFGVYVWKLGHRIHCTDAVRVLDLRADDELRANNYANGRREQDSELFWSRWRNENLSQYL